MQLTAFRAGEGVDLVGDAVRLVMRQLIEVKATEQIGAARHERVESRATDRNGSRPRLVATHGGDVELRIPSCARGQLLPVSAFNVLLGPRWDRRGDPRAPAIELLVARALADTPGVAAVTPAFPNRPATPEAYVITLVPTTAPQDAATTELVTSLRDDIIPAAIAGTALDVTVTGTAAAYIDFTDFLAGRIPVFFAAVLALSFLLLMVVFRSLLVPLKAVIMNILSIAATYGVLVVIFQWGWGADLIGIDTGRSKRSSR